jgi:hypothetical protein
MANTTNEPYDTLKAWGITPAPTSQGQDTAYWKSMAESLRNINQGHQEKINRLKKETDLFWIKEYEKCKTSGTPDFAWVNEIQNELLDRGWTLSNNNEWTWK